MKLFRHTTIVALVIAVGFLLYVDIHQAKVIQTQRHLLTEMWTFIQEGCPFSQLQ